MANFSGRNKGKMASQAQGWLAAVPIRTVRLIRLWDRNSWGVSKKMACWLLSHLLSHRRTFWRTCYTKFVLYVRNENRSPRGIGKCDSPWAQGVYTWNTWKQNHQGKARCLNAKWMIQTAVICYEDYLARNSSGGWPRGPLHPWDSHTCFLLWANLGVGISESFECTWTMFLSANFTDDLEGRFYLMIWKMLKETQKVE